MAISTQVQSQGRPPAIELFRNDLDMRTDQFREMLPQHIPVDRFKRVLVTAASRNPDLLQTNLQSLFNACAMAAADGLYPDGREGALVVFKGQAQWMPMVYGIIKKMRNSGELSSIVAHAVHAKDDFEYVLGDDERIEHRPFMGEGDPGPLIAVYAIAKLKDGTVQREVMSKAQVDKVRAVSRSQNGPWGQWYDEMARKTVVRRLSKYLPMSTELEQVLSRDDALYALNGSSNAEAQQVASSRPVAQLTAFERAAGGMQIEATATTQPDPDTPAFTLVCASGEVLTWEDRADAEAVAEEFAKELAIGGMEVWLANAELPKRLIDAGVRAPDAPSLV